MKQLVVNADDLGRSSPVNQGIIEAHEQGIVTSASLMTTREGFQEAVQLAKAHPKLGIGLHLDLDAFFDIQHGAGRLLGYTDPLVPLQEIARVAEDQICQVLDTGLTIGHLDGHHHVHLRPELFATIAALAAKHKIGVIRFFPGFYEGLYPGISVAWLRDMIQRFGLRCVDRFFAGWERVESSLPGYEYFDPAVPFLRAELMVHPGKGDAWRETELRHCLSSHVRARIEENHIELVSFPFLKSPNLIP